MLFCVIYRTKILISCLQRKLLATLSLIINNKKKQQQKTRMKERIKQDSKHFCKHLPGILGEFP